MVSLIGDQFGIVTRRSDVGTRLDPNERTSLPDARSGLRSHRCRTPWRRRCSRRRRARRSCRRRSATSASSPRRTGPAGRYARVARTALRPARAAREVRGHPSGPADQAARGAGVQDRRLHDGRRGQIAGIGFYLDTIMPLRHTGLERGERRVSNPFAYLTASVLDVSAMRLDEVGAVALESRMALSVGTRRSRCGPGTR